MADNPTYSKQVIEIADYLYKHPDKKVSDEISVFCSKFQKTERTIWTYVKQAKEYNQSRLKKQEQAKDEVLTAQAKASVKSAILNRNEALKILSDIATGRARKIEKDILAPTDGDRTRAIQQLSKMEGWDAPVKTAQTDSQGNDTGTEITVTVLQTPYKLASDENELDV
jgi:hypothetical protein